ncbi:probable 39S ribosomal protein L45, mitochondrial [Harmonia axyridis]|uniref:probable 39S ribosomal protein L45, mitochondrial n=1 Tax=Harmonia axyridis TaxID=115357 RepID=UPI001E27772B|nr:probable 39S ribosomal protein L45, mitochondrial [Harmonia axyridis]
MAFRLSNIFTLNLLKEKPIGFLVACNNNLKETVRFSRQKHWNPKFKWLRAQKVIKVDLPNFREDTESLSEEEMKSRMKERGLLPRAPYIEVPIYISSTGGIFEPYIPPEGDGKVSPISAQGAKQKLQFLEKKSKTMMAIRKVRQFEEDFETPKFLKQVEEIYKKMHECMAKQDLEEIQQYITEKAYPEVIHNLESKTIRWRFLDNIELPYIVHARWTDVISKENIFAQITVRFHTKQCLAIYDRFGRLMHGSEILAKDVLEYIVFEKHLSNEYGKWRIHSKIIPDWLPPKEPCKNTYIKPKEPTVEELTAKDSIGEKAIVEESSPPKIEGRTENVATV